MTGFGVAKSQTKNSLLEVNLRAVNGRFFEPRIHLPREFIGTEAEIRKILEKYFSRGTLDIFIARKSKSEAGGARVQINLPLAKEYLAAYQGLSRGLKLRSQISLESIARQVDVLQISTDSEVTTADKQALLKCLEAACKACDSERKREGKSLRADLTKALDALEAEVQAIQSVREEANENLLHRFEQKIKSRLSGVEFDSARLSQEVVIQLEKSDINEEIQRLREHIKNYRHLLSATEPMGKKLEFYTQELLREVNTIGSKSSVSKLTQIVVEAKTLIERLREQVQNVE